MSCQKCNGTRLVSIMGKVSDSFYATQSNKEYDGYVPRNMGIGRGDNIEFTYCLDCGQIQGSFPVVDLPGIIRES